MTAPKFNNLEICNHGIIKKCCAACHEAEQSLGAAPASASGCSWNIRKEHVNLCYWETGCAQIFELSQDDETEAIPNEWVFCPYCGRLLQLTPNAKLRDGGPLTHELTRSAFPPFAALNG